MNHKPHVADYKKKEVKEIVKLLKEYPLVGLVNIENLPSAQFQKIRNSLRSKALIRLTKARLIKIAIEQVKNDIPGLEQLLNHIKGMPALIFTNENPFKLYKLIQKSKSMAPAKPGQIAPNDLILEPGPTPFPPGPIISELGALGIKTAIENGKVAIKSQKVVAKEGDVIDEKAAALLAKMGIEPMEISLNLVAILEKGIIMTKKVLAVDEKEYIANIKTLSAESMALAMHIGYTTKDTINQLLTKAQREAMALADSQDIMTSDNVGKMLAKVESQVVALKNKANL
ncbi:MAG: 50S ribosomal protein L10 [Nanoarchaeota archaeon]|nr:50S ribosomal protein L10 [Nanoarchaeota archaeon]MBU4352099.1 50S ribosomal protein L10 [Nanoarchaeota archaeon]MBU4456079.1 50S ribosomal protein L10 [Nanoarchaeota archaeon]MCG2719718.1 50S ribosomal protein L10 [Nanoarchaeota archaeon]